MPDTRKKQKPKKGKRKEERPLVEVEPDLATAPAAPTPPKRAIPPLVRELRGELWAGENPFDYADPEQVDPGDSCTNLTTDLVEAILEETRPAFWLELGTMLGGSALVTAECVQRLGLETAICCVDPFTGDVNTWLWEKGARERGEWRYLKLTAGRPTIYERFLANVRATGHDNLIVPLPATSLVAMRLLRVLVEEGRLSHLPEVIYLDAAHEPEETFLEVQAAWRLLPPGGVLFGDDWSWPSVKNDVRAFARTVEADTARMVAFLRRFEESYLDGNVFLYRGQWVLFRG
jgi:predicted O-methyltransferase YrrM